MMATVKATAKEKETRGVQNDEIDFCAMI